MKNYSRIYSGLMLLVMGVFILFEISSLSLSFQMALEKENEINQTANLRFAMMLKNTVDMLNDNSTVNDKELMAYLCDSIYRGMENQEVIYAVFDDKKELYVSRLSNIKTGDRSNYSSLTDLYTEYYTNGDRNYMQITNQIEFSNGPIYIRTVLDISDIYVERDLLLSRYKLIVVVVFIVLALGLYFVTSSFEKNIRISEEMKQLKIISKRQEEFSASFAHECKTPLTSIIGYSELLRTMDLNEKERKKSAEYIYEQGKRLERLTKQMMMLANLHEGDVSNEVIDVKGLIDDVLKVGSSQIQRKNIQVVVSIESGAIIGERDLYQSMLTNILDNARKACDENGKIEINGKERGKYYEITVIDNGCGMSLETVKKVTQPFYMANKARSRQEGGTGLGMAIAQKIADSFGVKLEIQSKLEKGTTITLLIPKAKEE